MTVNIPLEERIVFRGATLCVYWLLTPPASMPARKEYAKQVDDAEARAAMQAIDEFLTEGEKVPKTLLEKWDHKGVVVWEIKAPQTGKIINRLLCHRGSNWDLFVALARQKGSQVIELSWKETTAIRIKRSLAAGGP